MNDPLRVQVEQLFPDPGHDDWADVLRRAGPPRVSPARVALIAAALLLLAVPALAATGRLHGLFSHPPRQVDLSTVVRDGSGRPVASVGLALEGTVLTNARGNHLLPHRMVPATGRADFSHYTLRWRLSVPGGKVSKVVVVDRGRRVAVLCSPCAGGDSGKVSLPRNDASLLVNGRLSVVVDTDTRAVTAVIAKPTR